MASPLTVAYGPVPRPGRGAALGKAPTRCAAATRGREGPREGIALRKGNHKSAVTGAEKLFDSVVMGAVPVYWGCRRAADMLDPGAWPFSLRPRRARQPDPPLQAGREGAERSTGRRGPCRLQSVEAVSRGVSRS